MRIHAIKTLNLNSLYGEQQLNLDRDLKNHSLFLIRGETGAGKSTILDAISLALFARTARLADTSTRGGGVDDADPRLILSDGTGEGYAQVDFSVMNKGVRHYWRARWSVARARNKAEGTLQSPKRTLIRLSENGDELHTLVSSETKKDFREPFATALCGLDYEDFSRTVMLAQGQFQQFLRSDHKQRAELLERLTGTQEYADIGMRASERKKQVDAQVTELKTQIGGVEVLTESRIAELHDEMRDLRTQAEDLQKHGQQVTHFLEWLQQDERLHHDKEREDARLVRALAELEVFAPAQERLNTHQRTEPAALLLTKWHDAEKEYQSRAHKQTEAHNSLESAITREAESDVARKACAQELDQTRANAESIEPQIALARAAWSVRAAAQQQFTAASEALTRKNLDHQTAQHNFQQATALLVAQQTSLQTLKANLTELAGTDDLIAALPLWRTRLDAWTAANAQVERLQKDTATTQGERVKASERLVKLRQAHDEEGSAQAAAKLVLQDAQAAAAALTGGLTTADFRARREEDSQRGQDQAAMLDVLIQLQTQYIARSDERERLTQQILTENESLERVKVKQAQAAATLDRLNAELERLSQAREQLGLVLEIVERRSALAEGEACPLCGSMEHPYRTGSAAPPEHSHYRAERERVDQFLEVHRTDIRNATEQEKEYAAERLLLSTSLENKRSQIAQLSTELTALQEQMRDIQRAPVLRELVSEPGWTDIELSQLRNRVSEALAEWQRQTKELQRLVDAEVTATTALAEASLRAQKAQSSVQLTEAEVAGLAAKHEASVADLTSASTQAHELAEQLRAALTQHAWLTVADSFTSDVAQAAIKTAETRLTHWRGLVDRHTAVDAEVRKLESTVEGARGTLETCEKALTEHQEAFQTFQKALEDAQLQVQMHLDGRAPDEVAAEWKRRLDESQQRVATAEQAWNTAHVALETARTSSKLAEAELADALQKRVQAEAAFTEALREVGLASIAALEQVRLSLDEWSSLSRRAQELDDEKKQAEGAVSVVARQVEASRLARPEAMPLDATVDALKEESRGLQQALMERAANVAQIQAALNSNAEQGERLGNLMAQLSERQIEAERWKLIDDLIGTAEGSKFRRLAQGYHLIELADFANLRLEKLSDRYRLRVKLSADGAPTMDFLVQDAHQADRERPLTTLSGGETFMVSLALALALSDFRAVRMPIETVLIDEGFGTLDPVTLNTVVQALENLQSASGARVGIISHVAGLSERIGGRVLVKREAAGRSRIIVEAAD